MKSYQDYNTQRNSCKTLLPKNICDSQRKKSLLIQDLNLGCFLYQHEDKRFLKLILNISTSKDLGLNKTKLAFCQ